MHDLIKALWMLDPRSPLERQSKKSESMSVLCAGSCQASLGLLQETKILEGELAALESNDIDVPNRQFCTRCLPCEEQSEVARTTLSDEQVLQHDGGNDERAQRILLCYRPEVIWPSLATITVEEAAAVRSCATQLTPGLHEKLLHILRGQLIGAACEGQLDGERLMSSGRLPSTTRVERSCKGLPLTACKTYSQHGSARNNLAFCVIVTRVAWHLNLSIHA
eukprot:6491842-Amphidinium_carterae.1